MVLGFRFNGAYNLGEVRIYIDNICRNLPLSSNKDLLSCIKEYQEEYVEFLETHPYVRMLTAVMKKIFIILENTVAVIKKQVILG